jgi:hypothetical protein
MDAENTQLQQTKIDSVSKIQSLFKGYLHREKNKKLIDSMTFSLLNDCIDSFNDTITNEKKINLFMKKKHIRLSNFPSHISENIAKFAIAKKYRIMPNWDTKIGDLVIDKLSKPIHCEVKGFTSFAPTSFGPKEKWDRIYFVNGFENNLKRYKIYEIKLSNMSDIWKNIKINKTQTYFDQCEQKRRPRLSFKQLQSQLGNHCKLIFNGHISELNNTI